ncbi:MAG: hypothetical protein AAF530_03995 [Pseudomonadota bacterium]
MKEYGIAKAKLQHGYLLSGVLAIIGLAFLFVAGQEIPNRELAGGAILLAAAVVFYFNWRNGQGSDIILRLSDQGIWYRGWGLETVPWERIAKLDVKGGRMQSFLYLELYDFEKFLAQNGKAQGGNSRLIKPPAILIPFSDVQADPAEVIETIRDACQAARSASPRP